MNLQSTPLFKVKVALAILPTVDSLVPTKRYAHFYVKERFRVYNPNKIIFFADSPAHGSVPGDLGSRSEGHNVVGMEGPLAEVVLVVEITRVILLYTLEVV
jgi:hypothetical protein